MLARLSDVGISFCFVDVCALFPVLPNILRRTGRLSTLKISNNCSSLESSFQLPRTLSWFLIVAKNNFCNSLCIAAQFKATFTSFHNSLTYLLLVNKKQTSHALYTLSTIATASRSMYSGVAKTKNWHIISCVHIRRCTNVYSTRHHLHTSTWHHLHTSTRHHLSENHFHQPQPVTHLHE